MKTLMLIMVGLMAQICVIAQNITVTPEGMKYGDKTYTVIETGDTSTTLISTVENSLKTKMQSTTAVISMTQDNQLILSDIVAGFTKTDKAAGSAYLFDLSYKVVIDFKAGRIRVNTPIITIGSQDRYLDNNNSFVLSMGFAGKNDVWSSDEKKFFIYNEKGKLIEKSTKSKLETLFNGINQIIIDSTNQNNDW